MGEDKPPADPEGSGPGGGALSRDPLAVSRPTRPLAFLPDGRLAQPEERPDSQRGSVPGSAASGTPHFGDGFLERFEISGTLGAGGMGTVYRGRHRALDREVAVKFLRTADDETKARFAREGRILASLRHPNLIQVFEAGEAGGQPFLVMEVIEGSTLEERVKRQGPLPVEEALDLATQIAGALACAHEEGVLHRDLKSANVLIASDGSVKVCDFGLARQLSGEDTITVAGALVGTPEYLAPEIVAGAGASKASDLYSFGCVLMEMLTGAVPFPAGEGEDLSRSIADVVTSHLRETAPRASSRRPELPAGVDRLVDRCLAKRPEERPASALELEQQLTEMTRRAAIRQQLVGSGPLETAPAISTRRTQPRPPETSPPPRASPLPMIAGGVLLGILLTLVLQQLAWPPAGTVNRPADQGSSERVPADRATSSLQGALVSSPSVSPEVTLTASSSASVAASSAIRATRNSRGFLELSNARDGTVFIQLPGGAYLRGTTDGEADAAPVRKITLSAFWIGKTEVTRGQFDRYCTATGRTPPPQPSWPSSDMHPVVRLTWHEAESYCKWAGGRLPTEAEWEYAARGPASHPYAWGQEEPSLLPPFRANLKQQEGPMDGFAFAAPVGSFAPGALPPRANGESFCGTLDMTGNVWEWCDDWYEQSFYAFSLQRDPVNRILGVRRSVRGGAYYNTKPRHIHAAYRYAFSPGSRSEFVGFRMAR